MEEMEESKKCTVRRSPFSHLALYIIASGWVGFAVYLFIFYFGLSENEAQNFLSHFLSTEHNGIKFRALVFFTPFISTVIGFLVHQREKHFSRSIRAEDRYRDLFEHANDAIFILGEDTLIIDANRKASELLEYGQEELPGMKLRDFLHEDEADLLVDSGLHERFVCRFRSREGQWRDMELTSSTVMQDGMAKGSRIIARDITDFKCMQEELSRLYEEAQVCLVDKSHELMNTRKNLLFESFERQKAEEALDEFIMEKKFGPHAPLPPKPDDND